MRLTGVYADKKREGKRPYSMRWRIIGVLLICWMIPFAFLIGVLGVYLAGNHSDMTAENFHSQLSFNNKICVERLNAVIDASRQASYDQTLLKTLDNYRSGRTGYVEASKAYKEYLTMKYQKNDALSGVILWFGDEEEPDLFSVYNERADGTYQQVRVYQEKDHEDVAAYGAGLGTRIGFLERSGRLYLVRNLVDNHFERQGTLVFLLNQSYCFSSLDEYPLADGVAISLGGQTLWLMENPRLEEWMAQDGEATQTGGTAKGGETARDGEEGQKASEAMPYEWLGGRLYLRDTQKGDRYTLETAVLMQREVTRYPFYGYQYVLAGMLFSLIPMLLLMMYVFRRQVTDPVAMLSDGARHIEEGELGYQLAGPAGSLEFTYLRDSFNQMSEHLKRQFDRIYQEEIALREARIMALQSHINPHFMNNTLEIINWEARLNGNLKVSKMIEALSTVLDAALDRRNRPFVRLAEEMGYVNAYLYITKERFGKRLTVVTDLPEELMDCAVPRLILQPVIENAIEHGVVPNGHGTVWLRGGQDGTYLYLEVANDGSFTPEDRVRIDRLLAPDYRSGAEGAGSLGIANVNQRLRILYGEPCGLMIAGSAAGGVVAKLTMRLQKYDNTSVDMNKTEQEMPFPVIQKTAGRVHNKGTDKAADAAEKS